MILQSTWNIVISESQQRSVLLFAWNVFYCSFLLSVHLKDTNIQLNKSFKYSNLLTFSDYIHGKKTFWIFSLYRLITLSGYRIIQYVDLEYPTETQITVKNKRFFSSNKTARTSLIRDFLVNSRWIKFFSEEIDVK